MTQLAHRMRKIQPSPTFALSAKANQLKAEGKDIINLTIGEPDFDTPQHIKDAAHKAMQAGHTKYTAIDGIPALKQAVIQKFEKENHLKFEPKQIIVSNGVKQCLFNLMQTLLNPGDEIIIPAPYWASYLDIALMSEAQPVAINTTIQQHFKITPEQLEKAITPKTKLFLMNSPANPTGMAYNLSELKALAEVLLRYPHVHVVTDDMYEHILWAFKPFVNILNACPELANRTIVMNGVSKAYAMTGWRIGYAGGPAEIIAGMANVQSQATSNPNSIAQYAAIEALTGDQSCVREMAKVYEQRHVLIHQKLSAMPGVECLPSDGTFFIFPSVAKLIQQQNKIKTCTALSDYLLNEAHVAVMPGSAFGTSGCLRLSFAADFPILEKAADRMLKAFQTLLK